MKREVFISYASKEIKIAEDVCKYLEQRGTTCWIAPRDILPGTEYGESIIEGIENSKVLVLIYSENSNNSQHVLREVERAVAKNVPIIAYKINNATPCKSMEYFLLTNQWLDATTKGKHLEELHNSILSLVSKDERTIIEDISLKEMKSSSIMKKAAPFAIAIASVALILTGIIVVLIRNNKPDKETPAIEVSYNEDFDKTSELEVLYNELDQLNLLGEITNTKDQISSDQPSSNQPEPKTQDDLEQQELHPEDGKKETQQEPLQQTQQTQSNPTTTKPEPQQQEESQEPEEGQNASSSTILDQVSVGDYITFGSYEPQGYKAENGDSKLTWIVVELDKKNNQVVLLSEKVIDMKPFDVAESGKFDKDAAGNSYDRNIKDSYSMEQMIEFRGNSDWETSNIRTWLNSDAARISYKDQAPILRATDEYANAYDLQTGFLYGFSKNEKAMICEKKNVTAMNGMEALASNKKGYDVVPKLITDSYDLTGFATKTTKDKVYLLSFDEVQRYLYQNNLLLFAEPTQSAIDSDQSSYYKLSSSYNTKYSTWALRTPNGASAHQILAVSFGSSANEDIHMYYSAANGVGIRPAMTISLYHATLEGEGSKSNPYTVK